jgi:hypothetical protein
VIISQPTSPAEKRIQAQYVSFLSAFSATINIPRAETRVGLPVKYPLLLTALEN